MVVSAQHFREVTNGFEQTSGGLWTHRGHLIARSTPQRMASSPNPYRDSNVELMVDTPNEPRLGFHESNSTALTLYKTQGSNTELRVRGNDGTDYPLAGNAGSITTAMLQANAATLLVIDAGAYSNFSSTSSGQWIETPINGSGNFSGAQVRIDISTVVICTTATINIYMGWGWDGAVTASMLLVYCPQNYYVPMNSFVYTAPPSAGTHKMSMFIHNASPSTTFGLSNAIPSRCSVMEFRR